MKRVVSGRKYKYFPLIKEIAITGFKLRYQGSVLGYFWSLLKPLAYFAVLFVIFTKVFRIGTNVPHYPIYLLLGVLLFTFWSEATSMAMLSIASRGDLIRKVYFPRIVLVLATTLTSLIVFLLNCLVILLFAYYNHLNFGFNNLWFFFYVFELYILIVGVSFYLSAFYVKYKDIGQIWDVLNQILFYATPILYSTQQVPPQYAKIMILSPLAQIIQGARASLIEGTMTAKDYLAFPFTSEILILIIFVSGYFVFNHMAAMFAEEV